MTNSKRKRSAGRRKWDGVLIPTVVSTTTTLVVCLVTLLVVQSQTNSANADRDILGCDSNNVFRGYVLLRVRDNSVISPEQREVAHRLFRLRNCEEQIYLSRPVYVSDEVTEDFLRFMAKGVRPVIRDGRVRANGP